MYGRASIINRKRVRAESTIRPFYVCIICMAMIFCFFRRECALKVKCGKILIILFFIYASMEIYDHIF